MIAAEGIQLPEELIVIEPPEYGWPWSAAIFAVRDDRGFTLIEAGCGGEANPAWACGGGNKDMVVVDDQAVVVDDVVVDALVLNESDVVAVSFVLFLVAVARSFRLLFWPFGFCEREPTDRRVEKNLEGTGSARAFESN